MSTSLQQQLRRLALPQTSNLTDSRHKTSILFDSKEAATKDKKTIYELGISGLQELIALKPSFNQFKSTLFDEGTINLERAVEQSDVNQLLDSNIEKFLRHLSPYFLLRPAHLCLEWLLRRFQIHQYNRKALLALALPYHETNIFVKVLQTMRIRKADVEWDWLRPIQKPGIPLPKSAIINRASVDSAFLNFICTNTLKTIQEFGKEANFLQAHINFYAGVIVGSLENAGSVKEWHISTLLPSLLKGLQSDIIDFVSASFIIVAQLVSRTQLTLKLCKALIDRITLVSFERLRPTAILLLICIFDTQTTAKPTFSESALIHIANEEWFSTVLSSLAKENVAIESLCEKLVKKIVPIIQDKHPKSNELKLFMERLLTDILFPNNTAEYLISCFLDSYIPPKKVFSNKNEDDIIQLDSDDEMSADSDFLKWYSEFLKKLEIKYSISFDQAIKNAIKQRGTETTNRNEAIRIALSFRLNSYNEDTTDIYESLYHYAAPIRLHAVQTLITNLNDYKSRSQNYQVLKECLADRIFDDSIDIVAEVLKLPTNDFINILGHDQFVKALFSLLNKVQFDTKVWGKLIILIVQHLTSKQVITNYDANLILLMLMPVIFPDEVTKSVHAGIVEVMKSPLADKIIFLKCIKLNPDYTKFKAAEYKKEFLDIISGDKNLIKIDELFQSVQSMGENFFQHTTQLSNFLVLLTSCLKNDITATESYNYFNLTLNYCKQFRIKHFEKSDKIVMSKQHYIPQQLFSDFVITLSKHTLFEDVGSWRENDDNLRWFLTIFEFLTTEAFMHGSGHERFEWIKTVKEFLDCVLTTAQAKIDFFTNFYAWPELGVTCDSAVLHILAFKILSAIFKNKSNSVKLTSEHIFKLMVALSAESETLRFQVLETLGDTLDNIEIDNYLRQFIESILQRSNEICMDSEQFPLILFTILNSGQQKRQKSTMAHRVLNEIIQNLSCADIVNNVHFKTKLLKVLKHINDATIVNRLLPLASDAIDKWISKDSVKFLESPYCEIYQLIIERITHQVINQLLEDSSEVWPLFQKIFNQHDVFVSSNGKLVPIPYVLLNTFDEETFDKMPPQDQLMFIELTMRAVANSENDTIFLGANRMLKKCNINCEPLAKLIEKMCQQNSLAKKSVPIPTKRNIVIAQTDVTTTAWKEGVALLELLENKKKLTNCVQLMPPLFDLLKACVDADDQHNIEYTKQLTLSLLLHCCKNAQSQGMDVENLSRNTTFHIEYVVQCLRASQNPQTHNNALLLLSHCANIVPQQVLASIVVIFTFMGSSVVRHDDAFSFHIINNIIVSIVPILVQANISESSDSYVIPVLKVFSDIMLDVPEHRRLPLYTKLMETLGAEQFLWMFLCVVFEAHVLSDEKQRNLQKKKSKNAHNYIAAAAAAADKLAKRIEIALELTNTFEPQIIVQTCIKLLSYFQTLPLQKEDTEKSLSKQNNTAESMEHQLFDINYRTSQQLRHYRYIIMQFLASISSSIEFLSKIRSLSEEDTTVMRPYYQNFIIKTLTCIPSVNNTIDKSQESSQTKFWKVILNNLHDVLNNAISLLSPEMFLLVVTGLMQHQMLSIRKKVIELLINKLQQCETYFSNCKKEHFHNLIKSLIEIVESILLKHENSTTNSNNEMILIQQTALIAIKFLSKLFSMDYIDEFKQILSTLTRIIKKRSIISKTVLGTVVVAIVEISSNLKAHSLAFMPKYMAKLIEVLNEQAESVQNHFPDNLCVSVVTGIQKLIETLPLFLGPYTVEIIVPLSSIAVRVRALQYEKDQRSTIVLQKINVIWSKMATDIPARNIVPSCAQAYDKLIELESFADVSMVMDLLKQSISNSSNNDLTSVQSELSNLFLHALNFRQDLDEKNFKNLPLIAQTENIIIDAFVAWVYKLSETSFRPIFHKVYDWALKRTATKNTILTYFLLTSKIAEALKSLFVLFANDFIEDAARLLNDCNTLKNNINNSDHEITTELLKAILSTLRNVFKNDSKEFINSQRFEMLMQPIVDQLENELVLENEELQDILTNCIAHLAVAVSSDVLWKQLNHQVLLKTRTNVPEVRIFSFNCCIAIARKLGENFTTLLPETVPYIAELFEDENPRVEKNTRKLVQELESILGESLQKYL